MFKIVHGSCYCARSCAKCAWIPKRMSIENEKTGVRAAWMQNKRYQGVLDAQKEGMIFRKLRLNYLNMHMYT